MITKYTVNHSRSKIEKVEVLRETAKSVYVEGWGYSKERRKNKYGIYFDTWKDAQAYITEKAEIELAIARHSLQRAYRNIKGMKEP